MDIDALEQLRELKIPSPDSKEFTSVRQQHIDFITDLMDEFYDQIHVFPRDVEPTQDDWKSILDVTKELNERFPPRHRISDVRYKNPKTGRKAKLERIRRVTKADMKREIDSPSVIKRKAKPKKKKPEPEPEPELKEKEGEPAFTVRDVTIDIPEDQIVEQALGGKVEEIEQKTRKRELIIPTIAAGLQAASGDLPGAAARFGRDIVPRAIDLLPDSRAKESAKAIKRIVESTKQTRRLMSGVDPDIEAQAEFRPPPGLAQQYGITGPTLNRIVQLVIIATTIGGTLYTNADRLRILYATLNSYFPGKAVPLPEGDGSSDVNVVLDSAAPPLVATQPPGPGQDADLTVQAPARGIDHRSPLTGRVNVRDEAPEFDDDRLLIPDPRLDQDGPGEGANAAADNAIMVAVNDGKHEPTHVPYVPPLTEEDAERERLAGVDTSGALVPFEPEPPPVNTVTQTHREAAAISKTLMELIAQEDDKHSDDVYGEGWLRPEFENQFAQIEELKYFATEKHVKLENKALDDLYGQPQLDMAYYGKPVTGNSINIANLKEKQIRYGVNSLVTESYTPPGTSLVLTRRFQVPTITQMPFQRIAKKIDDPNMYDRQYTSGQLRTESGHLADSTPLPDQSSLSPIELLALQRELFR